MTPPKKLEERAREIIPHDSDQFFKNQKIDWMALRYMVTQALLLTQQETAKEAVKIAEDLILNEEVQWNLACNKHARVDGKKPYICTDTQNGLDIASCEIATAIRKHFGLEGG